MNKKKFSDLYLKYFESLCIYASRFFPEEDEAYDIAQEVMLKAWEKRDTMHEIDNIAKYLYRAVYNNCINRLEKVKVQNKYKDYKRIKLLEIELENFDETFYQWELREKMNAEIKQLSSREKEIFEMRYFDNMRYKEIASKLNISERTVETHLQKAVKYLRNKLNEYIK